MTSDRLRLAAIPRGFFVLAVLTGWLLTALLPLGQAADEGAHAIRVDALSRGQVLAHREGPGGGFTTAATLLELASVTPAGQAQSRAEREAAEAMRWGSAFRFIDLGTIATYFPAVYVPSAVAVAVARAAGGTPAQAFRAGRRVNVLAFALLGTAALAVAQRGRALIAAVLLLPMSLGLAASLSGDAMMIGCAALAAACATRDRPGDWWISLGLLTVLGLTKLPYAPLLLVPLVAGRPRPAVRMIAAAVAGGLMLGWAGFNQAQVMGTANRPSYEAGPLWPGPPRRFDAIDPAAQIEVLRANPAAAVTLVAHTLAQDVWTRRQLIGVLGWLHIVLPDWVYAMWTAVLAFAILALLTEAGPAAGPSIVALLGVALSAWAIMLAQYLGWTPVGAAAIEGLQGRYYLPLLPFLAVGVPALAPMRLRGLAAVPLVAGALGTAAVPVAVALASYLR